MFELKIYSVSHNNLKDAIQSNAIHNLLLEHHGGAFKAMSCVYDAKEILDNINNAFGVKTFSGAIVFNDLLESENIANGALKSNDTEWLYELANLNVSDDGETFYNNKIIFDERTTK